MSTGTRFEKEAKSNSEMADRFSWHFVVICLGAEEMHYEFLEWKWIKYLHKEKKLGILEIFLRLKLKEKFRKTLQSRYAKIRLHLSYIFHDHCFTVWFQSDFGILLNFINDTLLRWIMLNVYFVFSNFSKGTSVVFQLFQLNFSIEISSSLHK